MKPLKDMTGKTFGKWKVLARGPNSKNGAAQWACQCECNKIKIVKGSHLREGRSTKCKDCHNYFFSKRHGMYKTPVYGVWEAMIGRCHNPKNKAFANYGGRGIFVCDNWRKDFMNFYNDVGEPPKGLTLDRIDNNKGYSKQNCKWVSRLNQMQNTRKSHRPGNTYRCWKLIENVPYSEKSFFECIHCGKKWFSPTNYVTSGRCALCKCIR